MLEDPEIWEYAEFSMEAKEHGGPRGLKDYIRQGAYADGKSAGIVEGALIAVTTYALFRGGKWLYGKARGWYATRNKGPASVSELEANLRERETSWPSSEDVTDTPPNVRATTGEEE